MSNDIATFRVVDSANWPNRKDLHLTSFWGGVQGGAVCSVHHRP